MVKRTGLGKGLGALIDDADNILHPTSNISEIDLSWIEVNPFQPRTYFDEESLAELAGSIREFGLIQPLTLRKIGEEKYQIIAGERRFRAAQIAGLTKVPAYIREAEDEGMLELALIENIQREDLNAIEIALSYQRLIDECNLTQETLSSRVGKKRSTVANYIRLLKLPAAVQKALIEKQISMGHARALINIEDPETQEMIYEQIIKFDFSVRKVEDIVRNLAEHGNDDSKLRKRRKNPLANEFVTARNNISNLLNTPVKITISEDGDGKVVITFKSKEELLKIVKIIENQK
jgi:ParB family transcriptional regulator, chromosome partitioning protein